MLKGAAGPSIAPERSVQAAKVQLADGEPQEKNIPLMRRPKGEPLLYRLKCQVPGVRKGRTV